MKEFSETELIRLYLQFCDNCPKAYDFTCSGANIKECQKEKDKIVKEIIKRRNLNDI
jgi:hypothetical protein